MRARLRVEADHEASEICADSAYSHSTRQQCIFLVKGSGMYACDEHIDTRVHRVWKFAAGDKPEVKLYKIAGEYQLAGLFTKCLVAFQRHCHNIMSE